MNWRELLVRFALVFFCLALWPKGGIYLSVGMLIFAWLVDGGMSRCSGLLKESLVAGILVFCAIWLLGLLWGDFAAITQGKWRKYFLLLAFIPLFSLLNRERLPWAAGALLFGYLGVVVLGSYQWAAQGMQGIPLLDMSYLSYSATLGTGVILAVFLGLEASSAGKKIQSVLLWFAALLLLFLQLNQSARGLLIATLAALLLMIVLRYRREWKRLAGGLALVILAVGLFAANSDVFQERLQQAHADLQSFQQGVYATSAGYRLAMWDVGLQGIAEKPLLGHGSGMAEKYFEDTIATYKQGIYRDLPEFQNTAHYHNELIEIGVNLGILGILAFGFLLWSWFQSFKRHNLLLPGSAIVCFVFMAGWTDTFLLYSRIPSFLLAVTAIAIGWQKYQNTSDTVNLKQG